jgi:riboflavin synthase
LFTGLIEELGKIVEIQRGHGAQRNSTRISVEAERAPARLRTGDSIAVSGVCLTAVDISDNRFSADLAKETLERTSLSRLQKGAIVNLELPTPSGSPMGGHIVQGHVDGTGSLLSLSPITGGEDWRLAIAIPPEMARYAVPQGSITVEGISLTVASLSENQVEIAIIPHTYAVTNLRTLNPGDLVNIETDVLAKYAEKMTQANATGKLSIEELIRLGF